MDEWILYLIIILTGISEIVFVCAIIILIARLIG